MPAILMSIVILLSIIFWNIIVSEIEIIGALATALAFFATSWAAYEARSSAKAAFTAVELTRESLYEAKKTTFKQWLSLLFERCDEMHNEIESYLKDNTYLANNLEPDLYLDQVYNLIVRDNNLSAFVRQIYHTLNYIDKEFYGPESDISGKKDYAEQLANNLSDRAKIIVAIFGLKYKSIDHIDRHKLRTLLQKLDFFKNDLFFPAVISERQFLHRHLSMVFYNKYRKNFLLNIQSQIQRSTYSSLPSEFITRRMNVSLFFSILLNYENPAKKHLENSFKNYTEHTENELSMMLTGASKEHKVNISNLKQFKGRAIKIPRHNDRHFKVELKTTAEILNLSRKYISKKNKHHPKLSILDRFYLYNPMQKMGIREHISFYPYVHNYANSLALLKLKADESQQEKIKELISLFNQELKRELDYLQSL